MRPDIKNKTFLGAGLKDIDFTKQKNIDALSNVLMHEELHSLLQKEHGKEHSHALDKITVPSLTTTKMFVNPTTVGTYSPRLYKKSRELLNLSLTDEEWVRKAIALDKG